MPIWRSIFSMQFFEMGKQSMPLRKHPKAVFQYPNYFPCIFFKANNIWKKLFLREWNYKWIYFFTKRCLCNKLLLSHIFLPFYLKMYFFSNQPFLMFSENFTRRFHETTKCQHYVKHIWLCPLGFVSKVFMFSLHRNSYTYLKGSS